MKQFTLFKEDDVSTAYTSKIDAPTYEPKNKQPHILELCDPSKTQRLIKEIQASTTVSEDEKNFLIQAAQRHTVFNYERIADYYAHTSKEMQTLMEHSALVIVDFEAAIEQGYVRLSDQIRKQYCEEYE